MRGTLPSAREPLTARRRAAIESRGNGSRNTAKNTQFIGYGVVVKDGGAVFGEAFHPMGLKQEAAK